MKRLIFIGLVALLAACGSIQTMPTQPTPEPPTEAVQPVSIAGTWTGTVKTGRIVNWPSNTHIQFMLVVSQVETEKLTGTAYCDLGSGMKFCGDIVGGVTDGNAHLVARATFHDGADGISFYGVYEGGNTWSGRANLRYLSTQTQRSLGSFEVRR